MGSYHSRPEWIYLAGWLAPARGLSASISVELSAHPSLDHSNVGESSALAEEEVTGSVEHEERRHHFDPICTHDILPRCIHDVQPQHQSLALKVSFQPVYDRPRRKAYGSKV